MARSQNHQAGKISLSVSHQSLQDHGTIAAQEVTEKSGDKKEPTNAHFYCVSFALNLPVSELDNRYSYSP